MGVYLDQVPFSGIIRIRDMMYSVKDPFRLDQGDVSFDAPDSVKAAMHRAIDENRSHYLQTTGVPRLLELLTDKLRQKKQAAETGQVSATLSKSLGPDGLALLGRLITLWGDPPKRQQRRNPISGAVGSGTGRCVHAARLASPL